MLGKVIFIDSVHDILWEKLSEMGWTCENKTNLDKEQTLEILGEYDGIVIRSKFKLEKELLKSLAKLKFIARAGSGLENIDLVTCKELGIEVFSSPEGNRDAVAEHAMGMLLMLLNHLKRADSEVRKGVWKRAENRGYELKGKTIGLIGYGVMGKAFAQRLSGFEIEILAYDKFKTDFSDEFVKEVSLEKILEESDIVSLHTNYLPENKYMIDDDFINQMNKPFILINTARGFNVKTSSLVNALKSGKIIGACLDVLEVESTSFESVEDTDEMKYLKLSENVILSPHIAGWTHESNYKLSDVLAEKIQSWINLGAQ